MGHIVTDGKLSTREAMFNNHSVWRLTANNGGLKDEILRKDVIISCLFSALTLPSFVPLPQCVRKYQIAQSLWMESWQLWCHWGHQCFAPDISGWFAFSQWTALCCVSVQSLSAQKRHKSYRCWPAKMMSNLGRMKRNEGVNKITEYICTSVTAGCDDALKTLRMTPRRLQTDPNWCYI